MRGADYYSPPRRALCPGCSAAETRCYAAVLLCCSLLCCGVVVWCVCRYEDAGVEEAMQADVRQYLSFHELATLL